MNQNKQPDLDRWENEGGALCAEPEKTSPPSANGMPAKLEPTWRKRHDGLFAGLIGEGAKVLKNLDAAGGHGEARTDSQRDAMTALIRWRFVNRTIYKAGLVVYEITDAGRQYVHALAS